MLHEMIQSMTREEVRHFKLLAARVEAGEGRATLKLFDFLRKRTTEPETSACVVHVYGQDSAAMRSRLYAIRNKLQDSVQRSLVFQRHDLDKEQVALHDLLLARILLKRGRNKAARQVLDHTLRTADRYDLFHVKELILRELLGLAGEDLEVPVTAVIQSRKDNDHKLEFIRSSQNAMAYIMQTLRKTNFSTGGVVVTDVMARLQMQLEENKDIFQSPKGRIRLFNLTSNLLLQQKAFPQLELYLRQEYAYFESHGYFDRSTHRTKIVMLTWLVNTTYKNLRFDDSLGFSKLLSEALEAYNRLYFDQFYLVLENGVINNLLGLGRTEEAAKRLEDLVADEKLMADARAVYLLINLAEALFELRRVRFALKTLARVFLHPGFSGLDAQNQLQIHVFEAVLRFEEGDWEFLTTRVAQIKQRYAVALAQLPRQAHMLHLLHQQAEKLMGGHSARTLEWEERQTPGTPTQVFLPGENDIVDYGLWLRSKRESKDYRQILLDAISSAAKAP